MAAALVGMVVSTLVAKILEKVESLDDWTIL
jgi:hypothetical protein